MSAKRTVVFGIQFISLITTSAFAQIDIEAGAGVGDLFTVFGSIEIKSNGAFLASAVVSELVAVS